jgi:predicted transcriptional regulator
MYINREELNRRLGKTNLQVIERTRVSRNGKNINDVPEKRLDNSDRALIGILNELDTQKNIADLVGVSQTTVSNVSRGMIAPASGINKELKEKVTSGIEVITQDKIQREAVIQDKLLSNLASALGHVANNLSNTDAPEASKIAVDMSKILDRVTGNKDERNGNRTAIIINVPTMKEEKHYSSITV